MKHRRKLRRTQGLGRQDDLPQSRGTNALAQGGLGSVNKRIWNDRPKRSAFCLIDKRAVRARDDKIDFALIEIAQNPLQSFLRFGAPRKISAGMSAFDCKRTFARLRCAPAWQARKQYCSCAFTQDHSPLVFAEGLNRRRPTKQSPSLISIA